MVPNNILPIKMITTDEIGLCIVDMEWTISFPLTLENGDYDKQRHDGYSLTRQTWMNVTKSFTLNNVVYNISIWFDYSPENPI